MAKKIQGVEAAKSLDLTPIMNMVLCLIPLMLLSVVFMTITVIDVSMPQRSNGTATDGEPPKRLQVFISDRGFTVVKGQTTVSANTANNNDTNCPVDGPSICLKNAETDLKSCHEHASSEVVDVDCYNWRALYNTLLDIKRDTDWSDHDQIDIVADSKISYGVLVKAMDVSRFERVKHDQLESASKGTTLLSDADFNDSAAVLTDQNIEGETKKAAVDLFPVVVLGLPTMH